MKIDSHHHIWDLQVTPQDWIVGDAMAPINKNFSLDDLKRESNTFGISKVVTVQTVTNYLETPRLLETALKDDFVAGVVGWLDVNSPSRSEEHTSELQSH